MPLTDIPPDPDQPQPRADAPDAAGRPAGPSLTAGRAETGSGPEHAEGSDRRAAVAERRALIRRSGLFDADWYRRHHPPADLSDLDPIEHYIVHGVAALASPGPLFDTRAYLRQAWHLRPGIDDPLTHYLQAGFGDGQRAVSVVDRGIAGLSGRPVEPWASLPATSGRPTIAVVVHVFYVELFGEICCALALMPYRTTLLVTTDTPEKEQQIRAEFGARLLDAHLMVRVGANRGRNFGPWLTGFRDVIAAHDLMLHLHTKKSLHSGAESTGWRQVLLRTLLPATGAINGLIERFLADPMLGVLMAAPGEGMRYWGYNWLSNRHLAQPLFDRLGLAGPVPRGMFDYPSGGMFWARTRALARLLRHDWTEADFPPELGQTDGTIMHAIERIIVRVAADAGYGFAELDYEHGLCRPSWSSRNLDQYRLATHDGLLDTIDQADTVSFDVFDTLLTRICLTPEAVHRFIGVMVARRHAGADDYLVRRRDAETAARRDRPGDVDLDEIHARFAADAGPAWTPEAIAFVQREEVELDLHTLRLRTVMIEALAEARRRGRRIVLTSDSYLPRRRFDAMLDQFGLRDLIDEIYLSSERRARKDSGDLWRLVAAAEQGPVAMDRRHLEGEPVGMPAMPVGHSAEPEPDDAERDDPPNEARLLHVGDNEHSDIQRTADIGIRYFHVLSPSVLFTLRGLDPGAGPDGERPLGDDILLGPIACRLFNSPYLAPADTGPVLLSRPEEAGAVLFGPLLFAFVAWLAQHPTIRHLDRLFFVSREGWFLKRLYDAIRTASGRDDLPPSCYFHASRRSTLPAAQGRGFDPEPVLRGAGFRGSLADFFLARLGFVPDPAFCHEHGAISLPRDADLVRCVMELMRAPIEAHAQASMRGFAAYAEANGMTGTAPLGFVDVGYSATMQTAIQTVLGRPLIGLYMGVSHDAAQVRRTGGHAFGAFADGDVADFTGGYGLMLEAFLTAPHGQVIGYDDGTAPPTPLFRHDGAAQRQFSTLERLYAGVEEYALGLIRCYGPDVLELPFRPQAATAMLQAVRDGRLRLSPTLGAALSVEDDFCGSGEIAVFGPTSPALVGVRPAAS